MTITQASGIRHNRLVMEALEAQAELADWLTTEPGGDCLEFVIKGDENRQQKDPDGTIYKEICWGLKLMTAKAPSYAVEENVFRVLQSAAKTIQPEPFHLGDLPGDSGFVWLPKPLPITDHTGYTQHIRAYGWLSWFKTRGGDAVGFPLVHSDLELIRSETGTSDSGVLISMWSDRDLTPYTLAIQERGVLKLPKMLPVGLFALRFGGKHFHAWTLDGDKEREWNPNTNIMHKQMAWVRSFFAFVQQQVVITGRPAIPRAVRRRVAPKHQTLLDAIRVVTLRRPKNLPSGATHDEGDQPWYSHRFTVAGHWRQQWYPSIKDHKQIWIWPFVKGSDDLPFMDKKVVYKVAR